MKDLGKLRALREDRVKRGEAAEAIEQWISERCDIGPNFFDYSRWLFTDWALWGEAHGKRVGALKGFAQVLKYLGFKPIHWKDGNGFWGLRAKYEPGQPPPRRRERRARRSIPRG